LLDLLGILGPTTEGSAVEAGDDWDVHRGLGFANVFEIAFGSGAKFAGVGKVG
jgi:hypothetical protein